MIKYENYQIFIEAGRADLRADYFYMPDSIEEPPFVIGTPQCWECTLAERLCFDGYENLHIFTHSVCAEDVNRITDYKGVWGLKNISPGIYSNYYDIAGKRLYYGIDKSCGWTGLSAKQSSTVILVPKAKQIEYSTLFTCFCNACTDSYENACLLSLKMVCALFPDVIALHFSAHMYAQLSIMGRQVETLFSEKDCFVWEKGDTVPVFHHS